MRNETKTTDKTNRYELPRLDISFTNQIDFETRHNEGIAGTGEILEDLREQLLISWRHRLLASAPEKLPRKEVLLPTRKRVGCYAHVAMTCSKFM